MSIKFRGTAPVQARAVNVNSVTSSLVRECLKHPGEWTKVPEGLKLTTIQSVVGRGRLFGAPFTLRVDENGQAWVSFLGYERES